MDTFTPFAAPSPRRARSGSTASMVSVVESAQSIADFEPTSEPASPMSAAFPVDGFAGHAASVIDELAAIVDQLPSADLPANREKPGDSLCNAWCIVA